MIKQEFEGLIQSGAIAGVSISDRRKYGEGFELYGYGHWDDDEASCAIEEIGNCVTKENLISKILQLGEANMPDEPRWWPQRRVDATEASQDGSAC